MKTIHKYQIPRANQSVLTSVPKGAKILTVNHQNEKFFAWAEVETNNETEEVEFECYGTGWEIPRDGSLREYVGTIFENGFVWHIYKIVKLY